MHTRHLVPELMDDPELDIAEHQLALAGLRRINRWSGFVAGAHHAEHSAFYT